MSARDCYELGGENCATDSRCVLEYNIENENPTCVPRQDRRQLTDHEVRVLERVLEQILVQLFPSGNAVATGNAFNQSIQRLVHELRPRVDWNIRSLTSEGNISSWTNGVANVSRNIIGIVNLPGQNLQQHARQQSVQAAIRRVLDEHRQEHSLRQDVRLQRYLERRRQREAQREALTLAQHEIDTANTDLANMAANMAFVAVIVAVIFALIFDIDLVDEIIHEFLG